MKHLKRLCIGILCVATAVLGTSLFIWFVHLFYKMNHSDIMGYWKYGVYAIVIFIVAYLIGLYIDKHE